LSEAGPFASKNTVSGSLNKRVIADSPLSKRIVAYVVSRQNDDGGYAFAQGLESNAQDTYYGLAILSLLGSRAQIVITATMATIVRSITVCLTHPAYSVVTEDVVQSKLCPILKVRRNRLAFQVPNPQG